MFKYSVKIRVFEIQSCTLPIQIDVSLPRRGSYSMNKTAKNEEGNKNGVKRWHSNGWNAGDFLYKTKKKKKSTHPTQSNVKVHSMSILTGPHDRKVGYRGPPFMLHFEFWWCRRWRSGGREKGAKKTKKKKHGDLIVNFNNIHWLRERWEEMGPQLPSTPGKLHIHGWWEGNSATGHTGIHR